MAVTRRKYTKDYKEAAVAMAGPADKTIGQAAWELGINAGMLARWRSEMREAPEGEVRVFPGNGNRREEELTRQEARSRTGGGERDIKKSGRTLVRVVFAKAPLR
jgi:transposase-like protein